MSRGKIKLQPIAVRSPLPQGTNIPALPLPQQDLIVNAKSTNEDERHTGTTGITSGADIVSKVKGVGSSTKRNSGKTFSNRDDARANLPPLPSYIEGKPRSVWKFLAERANSERQENGDRLLVRATRREIARGAGIGSLDTVDRSLARLQGLGFIDVERTRGVNGGSTIHIKDPHSPSRSEEEAWQEIANVLERSASLIKKQGRTLPQSQLIQWGHLADRASRLISCSEEST